MMQAAISAISPVMFMPASTKAGVSSAKPVAACSSCCLRGVCLPCELNTQDLDRFGDIAATKRRVARGGSLYRDGDAFEYLYAVHSGAFKTVSMSRHGDEKITGFHLAGELLGLDAISTGRYAYGAMALEDSEVCAMPFAALERLSLAVPALQRQLFRALSGDISRDQGLMLLLGSMTAEQRLAAFLLTLSRRYQRLGFAADRFVLRMTREEMGNYLGLALETVSRLLSQFQRDGLIAVHQREIELREVEQLREIVG